MFSSSEISQTASGLFSAYASLTGFLMLFRSMFNDFIPEKLRSYFTDLLERLFTPKSTNMTMIIDEKFGVGRNQVFDAAEMYLHTKVSPKTERLKVGKTQRQKHFTVTVDKGEEISDKFENMEFKWRLIETDSNENRNREKHFELVFNKSVRDKVMDTYLPHVLSKSDEIKKSLRAVKLYSRDLYSSYGDDDDGDCGNGDWGHVNLEHPSTFDTLAMDLETKKMIVEDLERFLRRRTFYKRVGKAWKRGYLLYGPPGTGKSSLIAAMANHLKFDVYDLELSSVYSNSELKRLLLSTTNRSILVIEDIDCTKEVRDRAAEDQDDSDRKVTLSGILNFIDGLWSSCGDERIIIFTTNHKERLDPALLRPGRMDVHINMSYCTPQGFKILVSNYLGLDGVNHPLCQDIEPLIESQQVTPAEVAEELMKNDDADIALRGLLGFLQEKKLRSSSGKKIECGKKMEVLNCDDDQRIDGRKNNKAKAKKERKGRGKNRGRR